MDELRKQVLSNSGGEERVEVNQRHLIDKILARYSAEFVVFRELMQNADDAKASCVQIIFETSKGYNLMESNIFKDKCSRILFKNNGFAFRPEDWNRLKKIAEGNPDEQKIGAFGVGFYSLFSVCEEPFVSSGGQGMAFYWKGDQLFAKRAVINQEDMTWSTFLMDMREKSEGFTENLREVIVYFNKKCIIHIKKKMATPRPMNIPPGLNAISPQKMFVLKSVDVRQVQLDVERLIIQKKGLFTMLATNDFQKEETSIFLRVATGHLDVQITKAFSNEMERTTKKKPPSKTTIQMIFTGYDEHNSSSDRNEKISEIFKNLLPYPEQGRIFIGFPTHQTTGCSSHLAARLIPTVERESVDLVDKTLAVYNTEMLCLAGILCRILYEDEMTQISRLYNEIVHTSIDSEEDEATKTSREYFEKKAAHALSHYTFKNSTPNILVGRIAELQFLNCATQPISILTTRGVKPINLARLLNPEMEAFIKMVPVVPKILVEQCDTIIKKAKDVMKILKEITLNDLYEELQNRTLTKEETMALMKWWISYCIKEKPKSLLDEINKLLQLTVLQIDQNILQMSNFKYFLNPRVIPCEYDFPPDVLPYVITKNFKNDELEKYFGGWKELPLVHWIKFIAERNQFETNPDFAEKVLGVVSRNFSKSKKDQELIKEILTQKRCIPTKHGMMIPEAAYFPNVNLFPDLPTVSFKTIKPVDKVLLEFLGVRKHVDLQLIFDLVSKGNWNHIQLAKYLAKESCNFTDNEIKRLKITKIWPKEDKTQVINGSEVGNKINRYTASELYAPLPEIKEFGLPIINWNERWYKGHDDVKFLYSLGLREYPPLKTILQLASTNSESNLRENALKYFITNFKEKYVSDYNPHEIKTPFLPCTDPKVFETPMGCFLNFGCTIMKFHAIRSDIRFRAEELGVRQHPTREQLLNRLIQFPPKNDFEAREVFGYLSSQQASFNSSDWEKLSNLAFIPILAKTQPFQIVHVSPQNCFFKNSEESFQDFFSYIDFGEKANKFLLSCGVKNEPSPPEYAELLVGSSSKFLGALANVDKYLVILRIIAINIQSIAKNKTLFNLMCRSPFLLGVRKVENDNSQNYELASAKDIFIDDNRNYVHVFKPLTAPTDQILEEFYQPIGLGRASDNSIKLGKTIVERAQLFYYDISESEVKRPYSWVQSLKVMEVEKINVTYLLTTTNQKVIEPIPSCIIQDNMKKSWLLYITPGELDYLDIATHLGKHIFKKSKLMEESYLAMLLTTPLTILRRKYPAAIDRILSKNKNKTHFSGKDGSQDIEENTKIIKGMYPNYDLAYIRECLNQENSNHLIKVAEKLAAQSSSITPQGKNDTKSGWGFEKVKPSLPGTSTTKPVSPEITKNLHIALRSAVKSCRSNLGSAIDSQTTTNIVTESKASYCDVLPGHSLSFAGRNNGVELYVSKDLDPSEILGANRTKPLTRFVNVLRDLCEVFELHTNAIHVFYENSSSSIAFNRGKALFFNFRYYLGLHYKEGDISSTETYSYWYMTFCHELAHNFISPHNSEHEVS
ncbi:5426_t:CDS:10 [Diversispora eburnea]|uniref:5426_t:CDS:1 n=1 Tax=Diversispora eburnea TaxID=1213867 RepID=A0A9N9G6U9_9GLOM|nr:5426_t:CDS:10 [Diversispora eburnea]